MTKINNNEILFTKLRIWLRVVSCNVILLHINNTKNNISWKWTFLSKTWYKKNVDNFINCYTVLVFLTFLNFTNPYIMSNVNTLQSSEQDNTLIYLDEHRIYLYLPYYTKIVSVAKKTSDFRNKMCYIFGEYKVQD